MATAAQKARATKLQAQATKLNQSLKTATGSAKATMQASLSRTNKALSSFSTPAKSTTSAPPKTSTTTTPSGSYTPSHMANRNKTNSAVSTVPTFMDVAGNKGSPITPFETRTGLNEASKTPGGQYTNTMAGQTINGEPKTDNKYDNLIAQYQTLKDLINAPKEDIPDYKNPYADQMASLYDVINQRVRNPQQYDSNTDEGLKIAQQNALLQARTQLGRRNQLGAASSIYGQKGELQAISQLIPQYQQMFRNNQQQNTANMFKQFGLTQDLDQTAYNRQRTAVSDQRADRQANIGEFSDIAKLTGVMDQQNLQQQEDQYAVYDRYVANRGDNFDYQAEINKIMADDDPTNDWKIGVLNTHRQQKTRDWLTQINQYSDDFQKEINRREQEIKNNPDLTDPLLPYLKIARAAKISAMNDAQLTAEQLQVKRAMELWQEIGVANQTIASIIDVPVGARTADYQEVIATIAQKQVQAQASLGNLGVAQGNLKVAQDREARLGDEAKDKKTTTEGTKKENEYVTATYGQYLEESIPYEEFFIKYNLGDRFNDQQAKLFQALVFKKEPSKDDDEYLKRLE